MFEPKPGQRVMLGNEKEWMEPGRFIAMDKDSEFPFVGRKDRYGASHGFRYCKPILPDFPMDHPLWVWDIDPRNAMPRCFAGEFTDDGRIVCWDCGRVKHTADGFKTAWRHWSETDPNAKTKTLDYDV